MYFKDNFERIYCSNMFRLFTLLNCKFQRIQILFNGDIRLEDKNGFGRHSAIDDNHLRAIDKVKITAKFAKKLEVNHLNIV